MDEKVILNEKEITKEQLEEEKTKECKGKKIVEVSPNNFKTQLND